MTSLAMLQQGVRTRKSPLEQRRLIGRRPPCPPCIHIITANSQLLLLHTFIVLIRALSVFVRKKYMVLEHLPSSSSLTCVAMMLKPSRGQHRRQHGQRVFMGISWNPESVGEGVVVEHSFAGMPTHDCLFGGDCILQVSGEAVATPEDVVFYWDRAASGPVSFVVRRMETHRFTVGALALKQLRILLQEDAAAPIVASIAWKDATGQDAFGHAPPACLLHALQQPGFPIVGDLIIGIDGAGVGTRVEVEDILRRRSLDPNSALELSIRRGWPAAEVGEVGSFFCCSLTRVPKPKRRPNGRSAMQRGDELVPVSVAPSLSAMRPALLEESNAAAHSPEMES